MKLPKLIVEGEITSIHHSIASKDAPAIIGRNLNKPTPTTEDIKNKNFDWMKKHDPYDYSEIDIKAHGVEFAIIRPLIPEMMWKLGNEKNKSFSIVSGTKIRVTLEILPGEQIK